MIEKDSTICDLSDLKSDQDYNFNISALDDPIKPKIHTRPTFASNEIF